MMTIINGYHIEYTIGYTYCCVYKIGYIDEFGRLMDEVLVYRSESWDDCIEYANTH